MSRVGDSVARRSGCPRRCGSADEEEYVLAPTKIDPHSVARWRGRLWLPFLSIALALGCVVTVVSGVVVSTALGATFMSSGCETVQHGDPLGGVLMPGLPVGEVRFEIRCREFGEFTLAALVSGSAELAAALDMQVSRDEDVLYQGPLSRLVIAGRLSPGNNLIVVRGALAREYGGGGRINVELRMQVAGM